MIGLPLHLWMKDILKEIGDCCGGFLEYDQETSLKADLRWAKLKIVKDGKERPSVLNILAGAQSYEVQLWWEIIPWVARVFPA